MSANRLLLVGVESLDELVSKDELNMESGGWEVTSTSDGKQAISKLENESWDAIVAKQDLPDMVGSELLLHVSKCTADGLRVLIVGNKDDAGSFDASNSAHRIISTPIKLDTFNNMLKNSIELRQTISNDRIRSIVSSVSSLPTLPEIYEKLVSEMNKEDVSVQNISNLISQDIGLSAQMLKMANSAYFGLSQRISSVTQAVNMLGMQTVSTIVCATSVFDKNSVSAVEGYSIEHIRDKCLRVATSARTLAHSFGMPSQVVEDSLLAGALHDVGKLLMLGHFKNEFKDAIDIVNSQQMPLYLAEIEVLGVHDAQLGAYLLSSWGFCDPIVEAVAMQYTPDKTPVPELNALCAVYLASVFHTHENARGNILNESVSGEYLESLGLTSQTDMVFSLCRASTA